MNQIFWVVLATSLMTLLGTDSLYPTFDKWWLGFEGRTPLLISVGILTGMGLTHLHEKLKKLRRAKQFIEIFCDDTQAIELRLRHMARHIETVETDLVDMTGEEAEPNSLVIGQYKNLVRVEKRWREARALAREFGPRHSYYIFKDADWHDHVPEKEKLPDRHIH
jgi:hypothetical protein